MPFIFQIGFLQTMETFNIVLLGKSGHGKTLTANSLLCGQPMKSSTHPSNLGAVDSGKFKSAQERYSNISSTSDLAGFPSRSPSSTVSSMTTDSEGASTFGVHQSASSRYSNTISQGATTHDSSSAKKTSHITRGPTTRTRKAGSFVVDNMQVNVIDTPGILDNTTVDDVVAAEKTINDIREAFSLINPGTGFNAFVLVYKYGVKYTQEEQRIIERFLQLFGNESTNARFFIIFTNADDFRIDSEDGDFRRWLQQNSEQGIQRLVNEVCQGRFTLFENRRATEDTLVNQRKEFVEKLRPLTLQFTGGEFEEVLKKNGNNFMHLASIDERKSSFRKSLSELHMRFYQAESDNNTRELKNVQREMQSLWGNAHPDDRRELEKEKSEIDRVVASIRSKSGRFSMF